VIIKTFFISAYDYLLWLGDIGEGEVPLEVAILMEPSTKKHDMLIMNGLYDILIMGEDNYGFQ